MEIVRFATNTPEEVALQFADGKDVDGRYGPQVLFTLTDGRAMYLAPFAAQKIHDLKIGKGETFSIGKFEVKAGQKRSVQWIVKRVGAAEGLDARPKPHEVTEALCANIRAIDAKPEVVSDTERLLAASIQKVRDAKLSGAQVNGGAVNGHASNGAAAPAVVNGQAAAPKNGAAPTNGSTAEILEAVKKTSMCQSLKTATASAYLAEEFAKDLGYSVRFAAAEIYALACTIDISKQQQRRNGGS